MGMFYTASPKEMLQIRNRIFLDVGLPILQTKGFQESPFSTAWFGKDEIGGYSYELCRLSEAQLEIITVLIVRGDRWIQISLNIFELKPKIESMAQLKGLDGLHFCLPPNSISDMRLRCDDFKGPPILNYHYMFRNHKLKSYFTKSGLAKRAKELSEIIESDLSNIDYFIKRWHELHQPITTTWEGHPV